MRRGNSRRKKRRKGVGFGGGGGVEGNTAKTENADEGSPGTRRQSGLTRK
jgi:hypothetical protein